MMYFVLAHIADSTKFLIFEGGVEQMYQNYSMNKHVNNSHAYETPCLCFIGFEPDKLLSASWTGAKAGGIIIGGGNDNDLGDID